MFSFAANVVKMCGFVEPAQLPSGWWRKVAANKGILKGFREW